MDSRKLKGLSETVIKFQSSLKAVLDKHHEFHEALNGEEPLKYFGLGEEPAEYFVDVSDILFWLDSEAYMAELDFWNGSKVRETHQEILNYLRESDQDTVFSALIEAVKRKRVTPFVGAGLSKPCQFPLWGEAIKKLVIKLKGVSTSQERALKPASSYLDEVERLLLKGKYLDAVQLLYDNDKTQVENFIRNTFSLPTDGQALGERIMGPIEYLPDIADGCIVTTNFDRLIEETYRKRNRPIEGYMHGIQDRSKFVTSLIQGERCILKLHGNVGDQNTYIFSQQQYSDAYGEKVDFTKPLAKTLRQIFVSNSLVFIGCSLEQDQTLDLFNTVVKSKEFEIPDHFAILNKPTSHVEMQAKENLLLEMNIRPIWYEIDSDGEHTKLEKLLKYIADCSNGRARLGGF
ncbi:MAG: SIR2 family protein [Methanosarcinales archaeon]|nr:SIR2 family protein [Methanosarcinales archaeon]